MNEETYIRTFDFNRDSWRQLVYKLISWSKREDRKVHIPAIENKLLYRIKNGNCTLSEVVVILEKKKAMYVLIGMLTHYHSEDCIF